MINKEMLTKINHFGAQERPMKAHQAFGAQQN
jgi:hypothetical protein